MESNKRVWQWEYESVNLLCNNMNVPTHPQPNEEFTHYESRIKWDEEEDEIIMVFIYHYYSGYMYDF